jgi:4-carboxymuconolactone decarboxylase
VAEVLLHVAIYAGVPRANHAMKLARETYADLGIALTDGAP